MLGAGYTMVNETTELYLMEKYTNLKNKSKIKKHKKKIILPEVLQRISFQRVREHKERKPEIYKRKSTDKKDCPEEIKSAYIYLGLVCSMSNSRNNIWIRVK